MSLYLDTSLLVAALTNEAGGPMVTAWLEAKAGDDLLISDWVVTEFSSALSIKLRTGQIDPKQRADAQSVFNRLMAESLRVTPISGLHFRIAAGLVSQHELGLRAGDALHLAVSSDVGATLCTLDQRMAQSGPVLGIATQLV